MKQDKMRGMNLVNFLIPFTIMFVVFASIVFFNTRSHLAKTYDTIKKHSVSLADNFTQRIISGRHASEIISTLIDKELLATGELILMRGDSIKTEDLGPLSEKYGVTEINIYDDTGKIINSLKPNSIGGQSYPGHPVYEFLNNPLDAFIEEIRPEAGTGELIKFGYFKGKDGTIAQIGLSAAQTAAFFDQFEIQALINDFVKDPAIESVIFTDNEFQSLVGGDQEYADITLSDEVILDHLTSEEVVVGKGFLSKELLHVCAPVFYEDDRLGTLTVIWSKQIIRSEIGEIIIENVTRFVLITLIMSGIILYAYRKRRDSIETAYYDRLTGLPNLNYLKRFLPEKIKNCKNEKTAILMLNLSNFNLINLTHGYEYGDTVLKHVVNIYHKNLPEEAMLFRLESDKFLMVLNNYRELSEVEKLAKQILEDYSDPTINTMQHKYLNLEISIYELYDSSFSTDRVLHDVTLSLDALKDEELIKYNLFTDSMREKLQKEEIIERILENVISGEDPDSFSLHYQPLLEIDSGKIRGFEALARLNNPYVGQIPPINFIELAEKRNLIFPLENIILEQALSFLDELKELGYRDKYISVNISPLQLLRDDFLDSIRKYVGTSLRDKGELVFEITESTLIQNYEMTNQQLGQLRKQGIAVALDDFGTGYSSLAELRNMDIDMLKIDQSFIRRIGQDSLLITPDIIAMAHRLGLKVVAEGVETKQQLDYLAKHACDLAQGYYVSRPLPKAKAIEFLNLL